MTGAASNALACAPRYVRYGAHVMFRVPTHTLATKRLLGGLLVATVLVAISEAAEAQIYSWRDADGVLVLSDTPRVGAVTTVPVRGTSAIRATRAARPVPNQSLDTIILREATRHGVRPELVRAVIQVESAFNPRARSQKGAMGLMQLMPATAADLHVTDPYDPDQNVRGGVTYLRQLLDRFDGNEELALAAYNAGPEAVARHGNQVPPFRETRNYLDRVRSSTTVTDRDRSATVSNGQTIYKSYEVRDGRRILSYSDVPPPAPRPAADDGSQR